MRELFVVAHLALAASWLGSMLYSLVVVQPKVTRFFPDERRREEFLTTLAHGNRWRVVALIGAIGITGVGALPGATRTVTTGGAVALTLYACAAVIFVDVSWRHWPARVFALTEELAGFRRRLRLRAWAMVGLVGCAFLLTLSVNVGVGADAR